MTETDPNAPTSGAPSGTSRSEHEERAGRALQDLAVAMIASTILIKGIEAAPKNLFPPSTEMTGADYHELWRAASTLLVEFHQYLHQTSNRAVRAFSDLLSQR